ncbi:MAG TPA: hypothetical protein VNY24_10575 [Candidatus Acidoferrales bacterium]|nr:hypothetical protein [Candidatus Acidoferrales bacterium]
MQTILRVLNLARDASSESELVAFIDEEGGSCVVNGDLLGAGEWLTSRLNYSLGIDPGSLTAKVLALWASSGDLNFSPSSLADLVSNLQEFDSMALSTALVGLLVRRPKLIVQHPELLKDLCYRLSGDVKKLFGVDGTRPSDVCDRASIVLGGMVSKAVDALAVFQSAKCISVRGPAMELLKLLRQLKPFLLVRERPLLSHADLLLGGGFREFCQSCERSEIRKVALLLVDVRQQAQEALRTRTNEHSVIWQTLIKPIASHLMVVTDEASRSCKVALTPSIKLSSNVFKSDLSKGTSHSIVSARIINEGVGNAMRVRLDPTIAGVKVVLPRDPFDLPAGTDRIIDLECEVRADWLFHSYCLVMF